MKKAGDVLHQFMDNLGIKDERGYTDFFAAWKEIVGPELVAHCKAADIRFNTLIIAVDHPGWMTRVQFQQREILKKVKKRFPQLGITNLGFQLVDKLPSGSLRQDPVEITREESTEVFESPVDLSIVENKLDEMSESQTSNHSDPETKKAKNEMEQALLRLRSYVIKKNKKK